MRAIEFRFYGPEVKSMIYSDDKNWFEQSGLSGFFKMYQNLIDAGNKPELMQYTGLKDSEGNKIFEGDIVRGAWSENLKPMVVEFQPPSFIMRISKKQWSEFIIHHEDNQLYIVIGNKYQNKELLNEQKTANIGTDRDG